VIGSSVEVFRGIEMNHLSRTGSPRAARALQRRGFADSLYFKRGKAGPGRVAGYACETGIDHGAHAFNGDGAFRDVCREDDFAARCRLDCEVLLGGRHIAEEGRNEHVIGARPGFTRA